MPKGPLAGRYLRIYPGEEEIHWWDPNDVGLSAIGAYRAINTVGTPWSGGPTAYANTLIDLTGNGNNLTEGNGAVPWTAAGWAFNAAALQYFLTGLIPANDQSWSMFMQYVPTPAGNPATFVGADNGAGTQFEIFIDDVPGTRIGYYNGAGAIVNGIPIVAANLAIAGNQGYRDGIADGVAVGAWGGASLFDIYVGARNSGGAPGNYLDGVIEAVAIYNGGAAAVQAEALAIATAMAAL